MSKVVLSVAVAIILSLFSPCDAARKPSPPPPSPYPPVPIIPTCGIFVQFSLVKGNFTSSQLKNKNVCNKLAALFVAHYTTPFTWSCQTLTSRTIVIQAYPQIQQQAKAITSFQTLFNRNIDAQAIMQSIGGSCGDTLALSASCPTITPATIKRCKLPSPPPSVSTCNLTVALNKAVGGLTLGQCSSFGGNINTLYKTQFLFNCDGLQYGATEMSVTAPNNYNAGVAIGNFLVKVKNDTAASNQLLSIYGLTCGVDKVVFTSGPLYAPCAGVAELDFPCR